MVGSRSWCGPIDGTLSGGRFSPMWRGDGWVGQWLGGTLPLLPHLRKWLNESYPTPPLNKTTGVEIDPSASIAVFDLSLKRAKIY